MTISYRKNDFTPILQLVIRYAELLTVTKFRTCITVQPQIAEYRKNKQNTSWSLPEDDSESLGATVGCAGCFSAFFLCANNFSSYT